MLYTDITKGIIAKKGSSTGWLPLWMHLLDTAGIIEKLINHYLPASVRHAQWLPDLKRMSVFLALTHDLGKATPLFQAKIGTDLPECIERLERCGLHSELACEYRRSNTVHHTLMGEVLLLKFGCVQSAAAIVGAHHGKPQKDNAPKNQEINSCYREKSTYEQWERVQQEIYAEALRLAGYESPSEMQKLDVRGQVVLSGLLIMADWIASNERYYPYIDTDSLGDESVYPERVDQAWEMLNLPESLILDESWMFENLIEKRFGFTPNSVQAAISDIAGNAEQPGVIILEAPMGTGKTEASLAAAEILCSRFGLGGVIFALPTQATANGIFPRIRDWVQGLSEESKSLILAHGGAKLNECYQELIEGQVNLSDDSGGVVVHQWFDGRKTVLLPSFVICTIDQLLMAALKQKHTMLRHLGMSCKAVIIDECHAYDAFMSQYLDMAVRWLGAYGVPVIIMSATLPRHRRMELVAAYLQKNNTNDIEEFCRSGDYPLLTYTDGSGIHELPVAPDTESRAVKLKYVERESVLALVSERLSEGGCAAVVVNTVKRAQELYDAIQLGMKDTEVMLFHGSFTATDRAVIEKRLMSKLSKKGERPHRFVVVGTQVIEQSLDIDADLMLTELCPIDLLLQRIGRLQRHKRARPQKLRTAECYVITDGDEAPSSASKSIYDEYILDRTAEVLGGLSDIGHITLPDDISRLVQEVYEHCDEENPLYQKYTSAKHKQENNGKVFRISAPIMSRFAQAAIHSWLDNDANISGADEPYAPAVRDGEMSIDVIVMVERRGGIIGFLPWLEEKRELLSCYTPCIEDARLISAQRLRLPHALCHGGIVDRTIKELEESTAEKLAQWQQSPILKGELFLLLNEDFNADLCGFKLNYNKERGLSYTKESDNNE